MYVLWMRIEVTSLTHTKRHIRRLIHKNNNSFNRLKILLEICQQLTLTICMQTGNSTDPVMQWKRPLKLIEKIAGADKWHI